MTFRAGDCVVHRPSGETWSLATDETDGEVMPCGWPETFAKATDCELKSAATDEERLSMLADVAKGCSSQRRGRLAQYQLDAPERARQHADRTHTQNMFINALRTRLDQGAKDYGEKSFARSLPELLGELEQEALDIAGWSFVTWSRLRRLREAMTEAERLSAGGKAAEGVGP